jgi:hypothetical protein
VATPLRDGFHFSMGLGGGSVSASCDGCAVDFFEDRLNGLSGRIQVGGAVSSKLVLAAELSGWMKNDSPVYRQIGAISLVVLGYPASADCALSSRTISTNSRPTHGPPRPGLALTF